MKDDLQQQEAPEEPEVPDICSKCAREIPGMDFLYGKPWRLFMDTLRFLALGIVIIFIIYVVREIEAVKILGYDACQYCMDKTGASCVIQPIFGRAP